jgi:hypothetical protein
MAPVTGGCVRQLFIAVAKYLARTTYRMKGLFWLMVSEISVHNLLAGLW